MNKNYLLIVTGIILGIASVASITFGIAALIYEFFHDGALLKETILASLGLIIFPFPLIYYLKKTNFGRPFKSSLDLVREKKEILKEKIKVKQLKQKLEE
ncbi:hypothetical protein [Winogradskyella sp.]|uniref:hypothetical protein n=1 Tax=Winogradskyella sp. TaxID=1883156 RepID=UPI0026331615|nr:hypothetical protein [Winogradskyella sp.]